MASPSDARPAASAEAISAVISVSVKMTMRPFGFLMPSWRGGIRFYAKKMEAIGTDVRLVSIKLSPGDIATLFTSEYELKN